MRKKGFSKLQLLLASAVVLLVSSKVFELGSFAQYVFLFTLLPEVAKYRIDSYYNDRDRWLSYFKNVKFLYLVLVYLPRTQRLEMIFKI